MQTKYDTGDEVLVPMKIKYAMTICGTIAYAMQDFQDKDGQDILVFEGMIEGKATIGKEGFYRDWFRKAEE